MLLVLQTLCLRIKNYHKYKLTLRKQIQIHYHIPNNDFSHGHLPEAGHEIYTELDTMREGGREGGREGPLAKIQPEASLRAVSQL